MRSARRFAMAPTAVLLAVTVAACSSDGVEPLALTETEPGVLELTTTCADGLSADVEESADEVRIEDLDGESIDGDCAGLLRITLESPLNDRFVIVAGDRWVDLPATCPWGLIGPPDLGDRLDSCAAG